MSELNDRQRELLDERRVASVVTLSEDGLPHVTSVWFLHEDGAFLIAIPSKSAKGRNLERDPRMALMLDRRVAYEETGFSVVGHADVLTGDEAATAVHRIHEKYLTDEALADPAIGGIFAAVDDIAIRLVPERRISWDMPGLDDLAFGGRISGTRALRPLEP